MNMTRHQGTKRSLPPTRRRPYCVAGHSSFETSIRIPKGNRRIHHGRHATTAILVLLVVVVALALQFSFFSKRLPGNETAFLRQHLQDVSKDRTRTIASVAKVWSPPNVSQTPSTALYPWCHSDDSSPGLIYIKIDKASSSTLAGINIRLAHKVGAKVLFDGRSICSHTKEHFRASTRLATDRRESQTRLLWTFLRNPADRAMSEYFHFWVSRQGFGVNYSILKSFLDSDSVKNFQLDYVAIPPSPHLDSFQMNSVVRDVADSSPQSALAFLDVYVLQQYDFIGLVERFDESLAVMKLLWNVDVGDLMVMSSKQSGGYDDGRYQEKCIKIVKPSEYGQDSKESRALGRIQEYLQTGFVHNNLDYALYNAVNASLDKTIAKLGRERVGQTMQEIRRLRQEAEAHCRDKVIFPCSKNGTRQLEESSQSCYWYDSGCGYPCVDQLVDSIGTQS